METTQEQTNTGRDFDTRALIARTILDQLGGQGRLVAMTGARNFAITQLGISFGLPRYNHKDWVNHVEIELMPSDTYTVTFTRVIGTKLKTIGEFDDVYAEDLKTLVEARTGLRLSL